ncbi:MAG: L-lactate dehydrogenase, partial [uncultured Acetobacteraceae bacterium]
GTRGLGRRAGAGGARRAAAVGSEARRQGAAEPARVPLARGFRTGGAAAPAADAARLHLRRRRDRRLAPRQPRGLRRVGLRAPCAGGHRRPGNDDGAAGAALRRAVRHRADGRFGALRLPRRHRLRARRGGGGHSDGPQRVLADPAGGGARGRPHVLVPRLPAGRPFAHRAAGGPRGGGGVRHLRADGGRAGLGQPGKQRPQRLQPAAAADPVAGVGGHLPPALAVRHGVPHAAQPRDAALREHGRLPGAAGAVEQAGARLRAARWAVLGTPGADPEPLARALGGEGRHVGGGRAHRAGVRRGRGDRLQPRRAAARRHRLASAGAAGGGGGSRRHGGDAGRRHPARHGRVEGAGAGRAVRVRRPAVHLRGGGARRARRAARHHPAVGGNPAEHGDARHHRPGADRAGDAAAPARRL